MPIYSFEPWMFLYLLCSSFRSKSVLWFFLKQKFKQMLQVFAHMIWNVWVAKFDFIEQLGSWFWIKWRKTNNHFINQWSKAPPINRFSMTLFIENLRSKILRCSTNWESIILSDVHFWQSEVSQPEITNFID